MTWPEALRDYANRFQLIPGSMDGISRLVKGSGCALRSGLSRLAGAVGRRESALRLQNNSS